MKETYLKVKNSRAVQSIINVLSWKFFPFITAVIVVAFYYLDLDLVSIYYIGITGIFCVLFMDDLTPLFANFLFMAIMVSYNHSPSITAGSSDFYLQPWVYSQAIVIIALYASAIVARIAMTALEGRLVLTRTSYSLIALGAVFILNGAFSYNYKPMNLVYGLFLAFLFFAIFTLIKDNITCNEQTFNNIAISFLALSLALILELAIKYLTCEELFEQGKIDRVELGFGWGMYNSMGMLMLICAPSIFFLAAKSKYGYLYYLYALVLLVATFFTMSRQAMVGAVIIYAICIILLIVNGKNKIINGCITGAGLIVAIALICVFRDKFKALLEVLFYNIESGNGRTSLWELAVENFKSAPIFGCGFYVRLDADPGFAGLDIIPLMYHNTFFQLLGACGVMGVIAYGVHRTFTIISFCKNPTPERAFIGITVLALLIVNLLDNHLFYILPTLTYSALIAVLIKSKDNKTLFSKK